MLDLLRTLPLRNARRHPLRSVLTAAGVACGVTLFVAIEIINAATLGFFSEGVRAMGGEAALAVTGSDAGFSAAHLETVGAVPGVKRAVPLIQASLGLPGNRAQPPERLVVLGVDPRLEPLVRSYRFSDG